MLKKINLKTKKFKIHDIRLSDANRNYANWFKSKSNLKFIQTANTQLRVKDLKKYIIEFKNNKKKKLLGIYKLNNLHIGNISLDKISTNKNFLYLGIFIGNSKFRNMGIGSESISLLAKYLFKKTFIKKIYLGVKKNNLQAIKVYKKNGFKIIKEKKSSLSYVMVLSIKNNKLKLI